MFDHKYVTLAHKLVGIWFQNCADSSGFGNTIQDFIRLSMISQNRVYL